MVFARMGVVLVVVAQKRRMGNNSMRMGVSLHIVATRVAGMTYRSYTLAL